LDAEVIYGDNKELSISKQESEFALDDVELLLRTVADEQSATDR
jgi:hypothetical protein